MTADRMSRIEAGERVLRHVADAATAERGILVAIPGREVAPSEHHVPADDVGIRAGSRPMIASAARLLPHPESPTTTTVSPLFTVNDTSVTSDVCRSSSSPMVSERTIE